MKTFSYILENISLTDWVFIIASGCLTLFALVHRKSRNRFTNMIPSFTVTIGVLGTFWGITLGLTGFNENNISQSIPVLLDGMKTAFLTSLVGMTCSIFLKIIFANEDDKQKDASDDPIECLRNIESSIVSCFKSDEEYSLVSQVKLIRQELIDGRRETKETFENFAEQFSQMASESLVDELTKVVDKFNVMLNDLVSESFKELTQSTINLNLWQQEYAETIKENQENLQFVTENLNKIMISLQGLGEEIEGTATQLESMDKHLSGITLSTTSLEQLSTQVANQSERLEMTLAKIKNVGEKAETVLPAITTQTNAIIKEIESSSHEIQNFVNETSQQLQNNSSELNEHSKRYLKSIEESLEKELTKSLESFVGALSSLSNKFAQDYSPLTDKLRKVVSIAEDIHVR